MDSTIATPKRWYILQTRSNMEKKVQAKLLERIELAGLKETFGEVLVPEEKVSEVKNGKRKETMRKIYTGYVYVEMAFNNAAWHLIKSTTHVLGFVSGNQQKPTPVPEKDMHNILERMKTTSEAPIPKLEYQVGQAVSIVEGPFKDFEGVVESVNYNQSKLRVSVTIFGRSTPVDLDFGSVAKP